MNKRTMFMIGVVSAALLTSAGAVNATPTKNTIYVDGTKVNGAAYMINNNNYFKLRDVAAMVNGSSKQFEVSWNETNKRIDLTTNKAYTVVGGEMALPSSAVKTAKESKASVFKDGNKADYTGYNISDNNYYKLRDLCKDMNIGVKFDLATNRVDILTTVGYGEEDNAGNTTKPTTPTKPTNHVTPTEPTTPTTPSPSDKIGPSDIDYRAAGDEGIKSVVLSAYDPHYIYYPSYGKYSADYQNLLDTCGEEIVTKTVSYYTYCSQTDQKSVLAGYPIQILVKDERLNKETRVCAMTYYVSKPEGEITIKMPKSTYERALSGETGVFRVLGTFIERDNSHALINGQEYQINPVNFSKSDFRSENPTAMEMTLMPKSRNN